MRPIKPAPASADYQVSAPRSFGMERVYDEHGRPVRDEIGRIVRKRIPVTPLMIERVKEIARRVGVQPGTKITITRIPKTWQRAGDSCNGWSNKTTEIRSCAWDTEYGYHIMAHELRHTAQAQQFKCYGDYRAEYDSFSGTRSRRGSKAHDRYMSNPYEVDAREAEHHGSDVFKQWVPEFAPEPEAKAKQAHRMRWYWDPSQFGNEDLVPKPGGAGHKDVFGEEIRHQAECSCGWKSGIAENAIVTQWVKWHKECPTGEDSPRGA